MGEESMKNWMVLLILISLVIPFQNCGKTNTLAPEAGEAASLGSGKQSDLLPAQAESIEMPMQAMGKASDSPGDPSRILIYPKSGVIEAILPDGQVSADRYCLSSGQIAVLEGLLSAAKICEAQDVAQDSEINCTAVYRSPYAKLNFIDQVVSLGERRSGCHVGTDLCGTGSKNLQNFLMNVIVDLQSMKCDVQPL